MKNPMDMTGRLIMVTGASSGIGRATAQLLAELGARVVAVGRDQARLEETLKSLTGEGHMVDSFDFDQTAGISDWFRAVVARSGPFDGLAHCAGIQYFMPLRVFSSAALETMFRVNTISAAMLLKAFTARGMSKEKPSAVFVSSTAAVRGVPANAHYGATKAALISLAQSLAVELAGTGVRLNCVAPGMVETAILERSRETMPAELFDRVVAAHPLGIGQPIDVANAIAFLLADTGRWITGTTLFVDGGLSAG